MTLEEWIELYNSKTPAPFVRDKRYELFYCPDKGFCEIGQSGNMIIAHQMAGDIRYWKERIEEAAKAAGVTMGGTWCVRKAIKAYIRLLDYEIVEDHKLSDGAHRYVCRNKKTGKEARVSPAFWFPESHIQAYFVTWQI